MIERPHTNMLTCYGLSRRPIGRVRIALPALLVYCMSGVGWAQNLRIEPTDPLTPGHVVVLVNRREPAASSLAEYYCELRGVPKQNVFAVDVPVTSDISRADYDQKIARPLRDFLLARSAAGARVRCVVSLFGLPLRVAGPPKREKEAEIRREVLARIGQLAGELTADIELIEGLASAQARPTSRPAVRPTHAVTPEQAQALLERYREAVRLAAERMEQLQGREQARVRDLLAGAVSRSEGLASMLARIAPNPTNADAREQATRLRQAVTELDARVVRLLEAPLGSAERRDLPSAQAQLQGTIGALRQQFTDLAEVAAGDQLASLEGELALILWPRDYPLTRWVDNPLKFSWRPTVQPTRNTMMAVRLDGPDAATVRRMIDDSLATEKTGLKGKIYIDSRGRSSPQDGYGEYDIDLRTTASILKNIPGLSVVHDDQEALFPPGSAPDAAMYIGWYSLQTYIDSFVWNRGAVGYHIASFEAVELRDGGNRWVQQMLKRGVAATIGPVAEPYLQSFPKSRAYVPLVLTGKLTLAECYYATTPYLSWMQIPFCDPLYRPYAKNPALTWDAAMAIVKDEK